MPVPKSHITVCICTYQRAVLLKRLFDALDSQKTSDAFTYSVVVVDNDPAKSAEETVLAFAGTAGIPVTYCHEPRQNIALARNRALKEANGDFIAFIDDDEFPVEDWLVRMFDMLADSQISGVLGPVRPHFEEKPPQWVIRGGFCERPEYPTGKRLRWDECRTGNVVFRRSMVEGMESPFDPKFGNGGEDMVFFKSVMERGSVFLWCNEAAAYESVPLSRLRRTYMLRRALLRGKNILKHSNGRWKYIKTSLVAVPLYLLILPFVCLGGFHWFMKFAIKLCDHTGRLLALAGLNPISEREA